MKISVIIPVLNEQAVVADSIERAWIAGAAEVVVADGGSDDSTVDEARSQQCQLVRAEKGRASQMNAGANAATGDVLLFLHADNWLVENGCSQIREAIVRSGVRWGGFRQQINDPGFLFRLIERGNSLRIRWQGLVYGDQGLFVTRSLFEFHGGFPDLPLMEDFEFSNRLAADSRPLLLDGPIHVSARRWKSKGVVRQTLRNWRISTAYRFGVSTDLLAKWYEA